MKNICAIIAVVFCIAIFLAGCRGEDATPYYNYIGGTGTSGETPSDTAADETTSETTGSDETPALESGETTHTPTAAEIDLSGCKKTAMPPGKGFLYDQAAFNTLWGEWCGTLAVPDDANLAKSVIAYYFANLGGCEEVAFKGVRKEGSKVFVDIEKTVKKGTESNPCYCPSILKFRRMMYAVEKTEGATMEFHETTVEKSCE